MNKKFVHLHLHTEYSLLDGFARIDRLFSRVKELGMDSVAITDHGSMFGVVDFYKKAITMGIKPIIGCEVYVAPRTLKDKDSNFDKKMGHLVLLVKDEIGYKNLIKMVSISYLDGFYYKPRIDYDFLEKNSEGLICTSACLGGDIQNLLIEDKYDEALKLSKRLNGIMGDSNFYLELQDQGIDIQKKVNSQLIRISNETGIPLIATNDVHYINKSDADAHDVLLCIQTGKILTEPGRLKFPNDEFYLKSHEEMMNIFSYVPEAIENTWKIAERCNYDFSFDKLHLPQYTTDVKFDSKKKLRELCDCGLRERYGDVETIHFERLEFELNTIEKMGYEDYFLIVWDFIKFAKDSGIMVGPGRGSCGGSIVAYVLRITDVDPLKYDLIFERFLNPERITMPDIDIDFEDDRRQEVIDYVVRKYGQDKVAQIITFGTMAARAALRDVGRVMNIPYGDVDKIAKAVPFQIGMTIEKAKKTSPKFEELYNFSNSNKKLIDFATMLEGVPRHASTHAAGVVISKNAVDSYVPLYVQDGNVSTQFNMTLLEELGLLKMDFLGLRTLSIIKGTIERVKKARNIDIDINEIPLDDKKVYELISSGNDLGIFQLESSGMIRFMKELKPTALEDIIAGISLYRPGPMESIPKYIFNKNNPDKIKFVHPLLRDILDVTYGCLVYQEQVMEIVRKLGGYSYGRSDLVRRAMSKKKMKVMEEERKYFINGKYDENGNVEIEGCIRRGINEKIANEIFDDMIDFAKYAFNKSHAAGYALIAYQTAYLKTNYKLEFMASIMTSVMGNHGKIAKYIYNAKEMGIAVLPPSINESEKYFTVSGDSIRYGLLAVKNVGTGIVSAILNARKSKKISGFLDFCETIDGKELNKKAVESLIKAGAFDEFSEKRSVLLSVFEKTIERVHTDRRKNVEGQFSLFGGNFQIPNEMNLAKLPEVDEFPINYLLSFEKEMLGVYISGHPLSEVKDLILKVSTTNIGEIRDSAEGESQEIKDNQRVVIAGIVSGITKKITKNNTTMGFIQIEDLYSSIEVIAFPRIFIKSIEFLSTDIFVIIKGRVNFKEDEDPKIIADEILKLDSIDLKKEAHQKLYIKIFRVDNFKINAIIDILKDFPGESPVVIYAEKEKRKLQVDKKFFAEISDELIRELEIITGKKTVIAK